MERIFNGSAKRTLQKMVNKGLLKVSDLDTPSEGWFIAMGYDRENKTGKWKRLLRTKCGATPSLRLEQIPKWTNTLTGKVTFDPVEYEKQN
tara:strand:+ start:102 stop:374 length:273 start_codon:yes stop_codon:yes gene_type:complete